MRKCKACGAEILKRNRVYCPDCSNKRHKAINKEPRLRLDALRCCELCGQDITECKC